MSLSILLIIFILHFALVLRFMVSPVNKLRHRKEFLIPVLLVPLFGPLMALTVEILYLLGDPGTKPLGLESLKFDHDIFWTPLKSPDKNDDVIPLEEAILINDIRVRRKAVLKTFREDPSKYLEVLMVARNNEDVDTTHYATIQISKIQRQFQLKLQKYATNYENDPDNQALLDKYIDLLGNYLDSPLPEKSILRHQRKVYAGLLDRKLEHVANDRVTLIRKLRISSELKENYNLAKGVMDTLLKFWPEDEETWIESLRACVEWQDRDRMLALINEMETQKIQWTKHGRETVRPWVQL
jgi:hypothetical protein